MYKTLTAMTAGIFTALIASALIENYLNPDGIGLGGRDSPLTGSFGEGEWYQVDYADIALVALFGVLFFASYYTGRRRKNETRWFRTFTGAALATSIAVIFAKMIRSSSSLNVNRMNAPTNGIYNRGDNIRPLANYNYTQAVNQSSGCACGM